MADAKLSALTALTGVQLDPAADLLYIDDLSVTTSKKILVNELRSSLMYKTTVASATSPDIFAATVGPIVDYTGTTIATGFTTAGIAGSNRILVCAGAARFTAGANMLIDGTTSGNTYTCAAGDKVLCIAVTTTQFRLTIFKADGTAVVSSTGVTSVSGTAPVASSGGTTPAISMAAASSGVDGYMTGTYATQLDADVAAVAIMKDGGHSGLYQCVSAFNQSGSQVNTGATVAGASLQVNINGSPSGTGMTGTWRNISGSGVLNANYGMFQRIA